LSTGASANPIAFPGAESFGKYATGGRGGKVFVVTNLNDNGPGILREAIKAKEPRIIVFAVSGTIHLQSVFEIKSENVTIAGHSAPGDGICLADYPVVIKANNVIVRYMRFRMGDRYHNVGATAGSGHDDAFSSIKKSNIIIDHCSMSWSTDEVCSVYAGHSTTLQRNIISEPLNFSYHFEKGDKDFENHGYGGILGGLHTSFHHNLYAYCVSRTPRFNGTWHTETELVDFKNNVIYNWGTNNVYGGEGGTYNIENNYYKPGPTTKESARTKVANPYKSPSIPFGKFFINGNKVEGGDNISNNNWLGVTMNEGNQQDMENAKTTTPFAVETIATHSAIDAYNSVLKNAGASFKRDTLDQRIVRDVANKTGKIIDVQGGFPHGTPYTTSNIAWPVLKTVTAAKDADLDGMPDDWEKKSNLNANDDSDASKTSLDKHYSNIEVYLNSILK